jgi:hypothetical protein
MPMPQKEEYKFKKGDNLDGIAKKHGLKDGSVIWKLPDNKAIAAKRKKPEDLQAGDTLVIPPNEKEMKEAQHAAEKAVDVFDGEIKRTNEKIAALDKLEKNVEATMLGIVKELETTKGKVKTWGDEADAAAMIAQVGVSLGTMSSKALSTAKMTEEALEEANKELLQSAAEMTAHPLVEGTAKALEPCQKSTNTAVIFLGSLADSISKMVSPSFWASTATQMLSGKSWSDAVVEDVGDQFEDQAREVHKQMSEQVKMIEEQKKRIASHLADLQSQKKQAEANLKALQH